MAGGAPARVAALGLLAGAVSACVLAPEVEFVNRAPGVVLVPSRLAAMPLSIHAFEVDSYGKSRPQEKWAATMEFAMIPEVKRNVVRRGGRVVAPEELERCGEPCASFMRWGASATIEIAGQQTRRFDYGRHIVSAWRFEGALPAVRDALVADEALFFVAKDTRETTGHRVVNAVEMQRTVWKEVGAACVADLRTGQMVSCVAQVDRWLPDLSTDENARQVATDVLGDLYARPDPAPLASPAPSTAREPSIPDD